MGIRPTMLTPPTSTQWSVAGAYVLYPGILWLLNGPLPMRGPIPLLIALAVPLVTGFLIGERWAVLLAASEVVWVAAAIAVHGRPPAIRHAEPALFTVAAILAILFEALLIALGIVARRATYTRGSRKAARPNSLPQ